MLFKTDFMTDESGAVTVDWVVLTAAIIGLGVAVTASVGAGGADLADDAEAALKSQDIVSYIPAVTYGAQIRGDGFAVAGACTLEMVDGQAVQSCTPGYSVTNVLYEMSNGEEWLRTTKTVQGQDPVVTWANADGEIVDAPEAT